MVCVPCQMGRPWLVVLWVPAGSLANPEAGEQGPKPVSEKTGLGRGLSFHCLFPCKFYEVTMT